MTTPTNKQLREFILTSFDETKLDELCLDYFPEARSYFGLGMSFRQKVVELMGYCDRRQLRENLLAALAQERPEMYRQAFAPQQKKTATPRVYQPQPRNPRQIFVSHASEDADLAHRIAADLQAEGYDIFITPDSIRPGEKWGPAIDRGLDESGIFVALLTPNAMRSGWVRDETYAAIALANKNKMQVYFLDVEDCNPPNLWQGRQFLPFRGDDYKGNLANLLQTLAGKPVKIQTGIEAKPPSPKKSQPVIRKKPEPRIEVVEHQPKLPPVKNSFIHEKTGLEFVRIPAGDFLYGRHKRCIYLPEYWISKMPVTQAVYQRFITANPTYDVPFYDALYPDDDFLKPDGELMVVIQAREDWVKEHKKYNWDRKKRICPPDKADHPVVYVSWYDAIAFCEWGGLQLPTEEQWEKAARGTDGRKYPWGNEKPTDRLCNFGRNIGGTTPVGRYSPQGDSPYGCVDMSGNVWEWCLNKYDDPTDISVDDDRRALRGDSWSGYQEGLSRVYTRYKDYPSSSNDDVGFRVVSLFVSRADAES